MHVRKLLVLSKSRLVALIKCCLRVYLNMEQQLTFGGRDYDLQAFVDAVSSQLEHLHVQLDSAHRENEALKEQILSVRSDQDASFNRSLLSQDINLSLVGALPTFSGEKHDEHITQFLDSISSAGDISGWKDSDKIKICTLKLTGNARAFASSNEECRAAATFDRFKRALKDRFAERLPNHYYYDQLAMARQNRSEKIEDFADRVHGLCMKTIRHTDSQEVNRALREEAERRALDAFLKGLLGKVGENTRIKFPKTFKEAVVVALNLHNLDRLTLKESDPSPSRKVFVAGTSRAGQATRSSDTQKCFKCGMEGHYSNACRDIGGRTHNQGGHRSDGKRPGGDRMAQNNVRTRNNVKCFRCDKVGHVQRDCRMRTGNPNANGMGVAAGSTSHNA